eukprot:COSAG05_NODE_12924_length_448_cov_849.587393_1_plen_42_part_10
MKGRNSGRGKQRREPCIAQKVLRKRKSKAAGDKTEKTRGGGG